MRQRLQQQQLTVAVAVELQLLADEPLREPLLLMRMNVAIQLMVMMKYLKGLKNQENRKNKQELKLTSTVNW